MRVGEGKIGRLIHKMGYTRKRLVKVPIERNTPRTIELRRAYCAELDQLEDSDIYFLDESGFNLHTSSSYGYSPSGKVAYENVPASRGRNISLLTVISTCGLVAYALVFGTINGPYFVGFLNQDLLPRLRQRNIVLVMDNAMIHHVDAVKTWGNESGVRILYLPPYSPQLNSNENVFALIKSRYSTKRPLPQNQEQMKKMLEPILDALVESDFSPYYKGMRKWVAKGLEGTKFINVSD